MQVSDAMSNPWWAAMYNRDLVQDPTNKSYSHFNVSGLNLPITIESNPQYAVEMNRHTDGLNTYKVGAVSANVVPLVGRSTPLTPAHGTVGVTALGAAYRPQAGIAGCSARTGDPSGCASVYINPVSMGEPLKYSRLG